ncbi:hypothetical protein GCM10009808_16890 [Microbacterium sediminicola]|uniref:Cardiolipin synthase N-terminal domain-containing protein n=1 Tax=Microbacterium sediminicola TaxID=415210 RepID=A0ABN2I7D5_9MICO
MARVLLILAVVATVFWVYTIVDCAVLPPTRHRGVRKPLWVLIVVVLPVVGGLLWLLIGRGRRIAEQVPPAPDDDPAFLGKFESIADQDERIRRLEEELALLDAEEQFDPPADADAAAASGADEDDDTRGSRGTP